MRLLIEAIFIQKFLYQNLSTTENVVSTPIQHNEIINQLMNEGTDNASNSILMLIMYSTVKIVSILNILQYSMKTFKIKYSTATLKTMRIHVEILKNISKFNNTLRKSSFKNLHQILESAIPQFQDFVKLTLMLIFYILGATLLIH
ncbi:hypothetical protein HHI36_002518 [Cryptolaemus montrouzieri]|uniref:Uncharacterized protein n=1 Tax=Cryptolaemus montrouzieri TaxID=559131 RepID=A0ABD2PAL9_9CUCU